MACQSVIDAAREAVAIYEKALAVDAQNIVALNNRAVMHIILGRYDDAKAGLSRIAAGTNPKSDFNMALLAAQSVTPMSAGVVSAIVGKQRQF